MVGTAQENSATAHVDCADVARREGRAAVYRRAGLIDAHRVSPLRLAEAGRFDEGEQDHLLARRGADVVV